MSIMFTSSYVFAGNRGRHNGPQRWGQETISDEICKWLLRNRRGCMAGDHTLRPVKRRYDRAVVIPLCETERTCKKLLE